MDARDRILFSARICDRILRSHEFMSAGRLGCYVPTWDEVDTTALIERAWRARKRIFVPRVARDGAMEFCEITSDSRMVRSRFGIWEPTADAVIEPRELDVVITPLVAFDRQHHRIGMGGGYYDRCFSFLRNRRKWLKPKLIGVAFECQRVAKIFPEPWDVPLYTVVSETE